MPMPTRGRWSSWPPRGTATRRPSSGPPPPVPATSAWSPRASAVPPCSATWPSAECRRTSLTGSGHQPASISARPRMSRSPSRSWPSLSSSARPARSAAGRTVRRLGRRDAATRSDRQAADEAIDPICGMTVIDAIGAARPQAPVTYEGVTYYFCWRWLPSSSSSPIQLRVRKERDPMLINNDFEVAPAGRQGLGVLRRHPAASRPACRARR